MSAEKNALWVLVGKIDENRMAVKLPAKWKHCKKLDKAITELSRLSWMLLQWDENMRAYLQG